MIGLVDIYGARTAPGTGLAVGSVVRHKLYNYRGVVIAADPVCQAGEKWYWSNKTQPAREQPWYHVLVHDSGGLSTYVAHSNLEADPSGQPVEHPRIGCYFGGFKNGTYLVNEGDEGGCGI